MIPHHGRHAIPTLQAQVGHGAGQPSRPLRERPVIRPHQRPVRPPRQDFHFCKLFRRSLENRCQRQRKIHHGPAHRLLRRISGCAHRIINLNALYLCDLAAARSPRVWQIPIAKRVNFRDDASDRWSADFCPRFQGFRVCAYKPWDNNAVLTTLELSSSFGPSDARKGNSTFQRAPRHASRFRAKGVRK
jgi:hypothetical protein